MHFACKVSKKIPMWQTISKKISKTFGRMRKNEYFCTQNYTKLKKMKKFLAVASLFLASISGFAQNEVGSFMVTPKVGIAAANMSTFEKSDYRLGFTLGAEVGYQVNNDFSVSLAAQYSQEGTSSDWQWFDGTVKLDYINVPIMANYYWDHGITLKVGLQPGFNLSAKGTLKGGSEGDLDKAVLDEWGNGILVKPVVISLPVGIAYEKNNLVFDLRYNIGLTDALKFSNQRATNFVFQFTLGYKIPLK